MVEHTLKVLQCSQLGYFESIVKHTLQILQCLQLELFYSMFNQFSMLRMNKKLSILTSLV